MYILGVLPLLLAPFFRSWLLLAYGVLFISAAAGDLMVVWELRKEDPQNMLMATGRRSPLPMHILASSM